MYVRGEIIDWLAWLCWPRCPMIHCLQAGQQEASCVIPSMSTALRIRGWWCETQSDYENTMAEAPMSKGRRRQRSQLKQGKSEFTLPLNLLFQWGPLESSMMPCHIWGEVICIIQFTSSNANLFQETFQKQYIPTIWTFLGPVKLTHSVNHHKHVGEKLIRTFFLFMQKMK